MIYKIDYSKGLEYREKIPTHALVDDFKKTKKCFAFYYGSINEKDINNMTPVDAYFDKIVEHLPFGKTNYMVKFK